MSLVEAMWKEARVPGQNPHRSKLITERRDGVLLCVDLGKFYQKPQLSFLIFCHLHVVEDQEEMKPRQNQSRVSACLAVPRKSLH